MGLDSYKVRETKKLVDQPSEKSLEQISKELYDLIEVLPQNVDEQQYVESDIDQKWIRENEIRETKSNNVPVSNDDDKRVEEILSKMDRLGSFGKKRDFINDNKIDENIEQQVTSDDIPIPVVTNEEKQNEIVDTDDQVLIEQLSANIDKKHQFLINEMKNIYNSIELENDVQSITTDLQQIMTVKEESIDGLRKVNTALDSLISRFAVLSQRADELKTKDHFGINQQEKQSQFLIDYQNSLATSYGKYWFAKMTEQEKEQYIGLYSAAHNVSKEMVERQIEDSIERAYSEIIDEKNQTIEPEVHSTSKEVIREQIQLGVDSLKQIYSTLAHGSPEQINEFQYLYNSLSSLSKTETNSLEDEKLKLMQVNEIIDRINQLQNGMETLSEKTR